MSSRNELLLQKGFQLKSENIKPLINNLMLWFDNQYKTMKNKTQTGLKNLKPKKNLNHNIYEIYSDQLICTAPLINTTVYNSH